MSEDQKAATPDTETKKQGKENKKKQFSPMELALIRRANKQKDGTDFLSEEQLALLASGDYDPKLFYWGRRLARMGFAMKKHQDDRTNKFLQEPVRNKAEAIQLMNELAEKYINPDIKSVMLYVSLITEILRRKGISIEDQDFVEARAALEEKAEKDTQRMMAQFTAKKDGEMLETPTQVSEPTSPT